MESFSPNLYNLEKSFLIAPNINLNYAYSIENPTSGFLIKTTDRENVDILVKDFQTDHSILWFIDDIITYKSNLEETTQGREFRTISKALELNYLFELVLISLGFMLILLIRIFNKKYEIAVYKSLGMNNRDIYRLILLESLFIILFSIFTALIINIIGGIAYLNFLPSLPVNKFVIYPIKLLIIFCLAVFVSFIIGSIIPLNNVKKINILSTKNYN
ncbi:MAG: hypothetical protein HeimC3_02650 [Candidatus Heimdallarchaeota archaeon LC_3]|nr:MAG: hypothetical protein HeimC3_02650 [Candidatus Heimdallarchaeota archaeon LC_3]